MDNSLPTVLITGFGLFSDHKENSSWTTVQELRKLHITDYKYVIHQLPVAYNIVSDVVPKLWDEVKPMLTVHCGMCETRPDICIEKMARRKGYAHADINKKCPPTNECCCNGEDILCSAIDVTKVIEEVSSSGICVKTIPSEDAGLFLCEFTYYTSLKINRNTIFVHIPLLNNPYSAHELAHTLSSIISSSLKQIKS